MAGKYAKKVTVKLRKKGAKEEEEKCQPLQPAVKKATCQMQTAMTPYYEKGRGVITRMVECFDPCAMFCSPFRLFVLILLLLLLWWFSEQILGPVKWLLGWFLPRCWLMSTDKLIKEALSSYHADQIATADYALETTGGSVLCSSDTFYSKTGPLYSLFGIPIWYSASSPREVIKPDVHPGQCWAMDGSEGYVTIQLRMSVVATKVSLEHIPRSLAPTSLDLQAAPKDFMVVGREEDMSSPEIPLGNFTYRLTDSPLQQFYLKDGHCAASRYPGSGWCSPNGQAFRIVTLKVFSNHGNPDYTCIYRFRVHGADPTVSSWL